MNKIIIDPIIESKTPDQLWDEIYSKERIVKKVNFTCGLNPKSHDCIRVVCISDTHNKLSDISSCIPPGDILIHAGDFTNFGSIEEIKKFNNDLANLPHTYKIVIAGNHELGFEDNEDESLREEIYINKGTKKGYKELDNCIYIQDKLIEVSYIFL
ncbi:Calcineurin-like phosphoesterase domain, apaH type-containing protein [Strongyloides ratti]|uniref:Calcineurin-like phosphoesterase domain, apaH type-containing protein n=1 Tax=Strongyloides ratti TaxID=34506 RepID=A0A090L8P5_STRRB|nr:Calcineurin-like phosphoesterase domain, apaH type-containing protein [Strongyloides ratti]CEF63865.1 Calcineurin-like phosphoesterase domain, apaH type-containing protein [Strongyloides ratti]